MGAFENDNIFKILSEVMHSLSSFGSNKRSLALACVHVCVDRIMGEEDFMEFEV